MVPATVFVSGNIIYMCTSIIVQEDLDMYHEETGERCQIRQMSLLDEVWRHFENMPQVKVSLR